MKIIEGLKLAKEMLVKADDLRKKVALNSALLSIETAPYKDQKAQVASWLQAHEDLTRDIAKLRVRVARTNLATMVEIEVGGKRVSKCITEWIIRRKELAPLDQQAWAGLTDRGLKENSLRTTPDGPLTPALIVRFFDPLERDTHISLYRDEPGLIDRTLEVINATTDLVD